MGVLLDEFDDSTCKDTKTTGGFFPWWNNLAQWWKMNGFDCGLAVRTRKHCCVVLMCILTIALISLIGAPVRLRLDPQLSLAITETSVPVVTMTSSGEVSSFVERQSNKSSSSVRFDKNATTEKEIFTYSVVPRNVCGACDLFVYVLTASGNAELRNRIRRTYANRSHYVTSAIKPEVVFILGLPVDDQASKLKSLREENAAHGDILVGDFPDTYMTLTTKGLYAMHWASENRAEAQYIMKVDDDVFLNMFAWIDLMRSWIRSNGTCHFRKACISGYQWRGARVGRTGKWATPFSLYAEPVYPHYCAGPNYLMTVTAMQKLLRTYPSVPFLPWEDIYWTGITARKAGIRHFDIGGRGDPGEIVLSLLQAHVKDRYYVHHLDVKAFDQAWASVIPNTAQKNGTSA